MIREAIKKKCPPPLLLLFFMFLKFHLKSMDLSLFLEGGWVCRKDHLVTLLRCRYWLGGENNVIANGGAVGEFIGRRAYVILEHFLIL